MLDIATAYNRYRFLGYEFLTWLWFAMENKPGVLQPKSDIGTLQLGDLPAGAYRALTPGELSRLLATVGMEPKTGSGDHGGAP